MKKNSLVLGLVSLFILGLRMAAFPDELIWEDISRGNLDIRSILLNLKNTSIIYIGSSNGVLKTEDSAETWRSILSIRGQNRAVNFLLFAPQDKNSLYAATGEGLFYSTNQGKNWKRIFRGKSYLESQCTSLAVLPYGIYLGTKSGLFLSRDRGRSWIKESAILGNCQVLAIAYHPQEPDYAECSYSGRNASGSRSNTSQNSNIRDIYVACVEGVFRSKDKGTSWEKIFVVSPTENNNGNHDEEDSQDSDEEEKHSCIRYISIDPNNFNYLYLATTKGVYFSQDRGESWQLIPDYGLLSQNVQFSFISHKSDIYALTKSGIFEYRNSRWYELSLRLMADTIYFLAQDNQDNLYAACDKGLFKAKIGNVPKSEGDDALSLYIKAEPKIAEVQQAAIKYAEVEADKIKEWRKKAKMKAILPKLTVGIDNSKSTNYEIYTSATTRYVYEGPDDNSSGWDVTLSWDLGDLIWNNDQTSIDVRSRLMVQLRDDILDEVTKLYFERLRVKMELDSLSLEERKKRFEKELRLEELTASLDALTGGYFLQQIKNSKIGS